MNYLFDLVYVRLVWRRKNPTSDAIFTFCILLPDLTFLICSNLWTNLVSCLIQTFRTTYIPLKKWRNKKKKLRIERGTFLLHAIQVAWNLKYQSLKTNKNKWNLNSVWWDFAYLDLLIHYNISISRVAGVCCMGEIIKTDV